MTITIELSPELENKIRHNATAAGVDAEAYVVSMLAAGLANSKPQPTSTPCLSAEESRLLLAIHEGMPQDSWRRYRDLGDKLRAETITPEELGEFNALTDVIELANAKRLENLVELARLRKVKLGDLMHELGIRDPGYA